jgi:hypothetical protein
MACEDLVVGCFLDDRAPLAVPAATVSPFIFLY